MKFKYHRLKIRRKFRAQKRAVQASAEVANKNIDRHIFRRFHNWQYAKRFLLTWAALMLLVVIGLMLQMRALTQTYIFVTPASGGVYSEGIIGTSKNSNPIFSTNSVDNAVSSLVFSSLLQYNDKNELVGDLATKWESDPFGKVFTVNIRKDVYWHDGERLTADDVVYTYSIIQNPDTKSPLYDSWRRIKVEKVDEFAVKFSLPNAYSPFPHLLTNGIIPEHLLTNTEPSDLRSARYNTNELIGSGPFMLRSISVQNDDLGQKDIIQLVKNQNYYKGQVQLDGFTIRTYPDKQQLEDALKKKEIISAAGVSPDIAVDTDGSLYQFTQTSALMIFMNTKSELLSNLRLRQALIKATNIADVSNKTGYPTKQVRSPILKGQIGYNENITQLPFNPTEVNAILTELGWVLSEGSQYRTKDGKELTLQFVSEKTPEYSDMSVEIQRQWAQFGIKTNVILIEAEEITSTSLDNKEYDALLYAINIGPDPDVYVYWHSSQAEPNAKPGFNLSLYASAKADASLEAGRSRVDPELRSTKYKPFLEAWVADVPAIGIHQPRFMYAVNVPVNNLNETEINTPSDRYKNVYLWQINTKKESLQ